MPRRLSVGVHQQHLSSSHAATQLFMPYLDVSCSNPTSPLVRHWKTTVLFSFPPSLLTGNSEKSLVDVLQGGAPATELNHPSLTEKICQPQPAHLSPSNRRLSANTYICSHWLCPAAAHRSVTIIYVRFAPSASGATPAATTLPLVPLSPSLTLSHMERSGKSR